MDSLPDLILGYDCYDYVPIDYEVPNEDIYGLKDMHNMLKCENPLNIVKSYCCDITFDIENGEFVGFNMLIDPTFKIYLIVGGGEGFLSCDNGRHEIPIDDKLNTSLFEVVEMLYKQGVTSEYITNM